MTSFPTFTLLFVQNYFVYGHNKKKITWRLEDMNFIFLWQKTIFTNILWISLFLLHYSHKLLKWEGGFERLFVFRGYVIGSVISRY